MTTEHEAPGQEATGQVTEAVSAAATAATETTEGATPAAATSTPDLATLLAQADHATLKAIAKEHPALRELVEAEVTGRAGRTIQQEREQIAAQARSAAFVEWQAAQDAKAADERLESMSDEELGQFYRENKRNAGLRQQIANEVESRVRADYEAKMARVTADAQAHLKAAQDAWLSTLPDDEREAQSQLIAQGKISDFNALRDAVLPKISAKERAKLEVEVRKEVEAELRAAERRGAPRPDIVEGVPTTSGMISQAVWDQNRHNRQWRLDNLEAIQRSVGKTITQ